MYFKDLDQIKEFFGIALDSPEEIRKELRRRLKKIHPDTTSGSDAASPDEPDKVLQITAALNFLDNTKNGTAVVPVSDVTALVKAIRDLVPSDTEEKKIEDRLSRQVDTKIEEAKSAGRTPRIFLAAVAAILTLVWLFPGITAGNPVLSRYINVEDPVFNVVWLAIILYIGGVWFLFKLWSDRESEYRKSLKFESTRNRLFESFIISQNEYRSASDGVSFNKDQLVSYIQSAGGLSSRFASLLLARPMSIDPELAQSIAETIISKALSRGIIKKDPKLSLRERYTLIIAPQNL